MDRGEIMNKYKRQSTLSSYINFNELGDLYSPAQVMDYLKISRWIFNGLISNGEFPPGIRISERIIKWRKKDLDEWIQQKTKT